jgi:hypothetical protein
MPIGNRLGALGTYGYCVGVLFGERARYRMFECAPAAIINRELNESLAVHGRVGARRGAGLCGNGECQQRIASPRLMRLTRNHNP